MSAEAPWVRVRLLDLPVEVHRRAGEHQEALRRELAFIEHAQAADAAPARLRALTTELAGRYGALTEAQARRLREAVAAGEPSVDLEFELPPEIVDATIRLGALLDELDDFCREGDLLTLVTPPELRAYRQWFLDEFAGQIREGRAPRPWRGPEREGAPVPAADDDVHARPACVRVEGDLDLASSSALRKVLVEHVDDGATHITVDLSACDFLDSTGLSLLVATHHRLLELGGGLALIGARDQVRGVLELSGTTDFFGHG